MNITISEAWFLLTGLSNLYKIRTMNILIIWTIRVLTIPLRNSDSEAMILLAVIAASPGTIIMEGIYNMPKNPNGAISRYRNPATLAILLGFIFSLIVIVFSPFQKLIN